jgi:tRNA G10  N-methylase Trm11
MRHPARFSSSILPVLRSVLVEFVGTGRVLDPFAGVGGIHALWPEFDTVGVEIEAEWADAHERTVHGDALSLPFPDGSFDAVVTSPTYGNRMADHHEAKDGSRRITYRHVLGRPLADSNSGRLQWGAAYREFHERAWAEARRVLMVGGVLVVNVSDHVRKGEIVPVCDWHRSVIEHSLGMPLVREVDVPTPRMRFGANGSARVTAEKVMVFKR